MVVTGSQFSPLNLFELLPPGIIVNLFRESVALPLDRYDDRDSRQLSTVVNFYDLNSDTRYDVLYEIKLKGLYIDPLPYEFNYGANPNNINRYALPMLWKQDLVDFIATADFGPVDPLDVNSPPLTSYFCIIGGDNSSCPGQPTYIAPPGLITTLFSLYIRRHNLYQQATSNIERLRNGEELSKNTLQPMMLCVDC